jgi:hypothetical protein
LDRPNSDVVCNSPEFSEHTTIHWTETIYPSDTLSALFEESKRKGLLGLIECGTFHLVLKEDVGTYVNIIPSCFVYLSSMKPDKNTSNPNLSLVEIVIVTRSP